MSITKPVDMESKRFPLAWGTVLVVAGCVLTILMFGPHHTGLDFIVLCICTGLVISALLALTNWRKRELTIGDAELPEL